MENVVPRIIDSHLDANYLRDPLQPEYRTRHSTEMALMKVPDDIVTALDQRWSSWIYPQLLMSPITTYCSNV